MKHIPTDYKINWWQNFNTDLYAKILRAKANKINSEINTRLTNIVKKQLNYEPHKMS